MIGVLQKRKMHVTEDSDRLRMNRPQRLEWVVRKLSIIDFYSFVVCGKGVILLGQQRMLHPPLISSTI